MDTDGAGGSIINNIYIDGCTFNGVVKNGKCFIYSEKATMNGSIAIKNSTFYNCVGINQYFIDFNSTSYGCASINIEYCIFGLQPDNVTKNIRASVLPTVVESYATADFYKNISGLVRLEFTSDELFVDPANDDFHFNAGTTDMKIGDPRWYND